MKKKSVVILGAGPEQIDRTRLQKNFTFFGVDKNIF